MNVLFISIDSLSRHFLDIYPDQEIEYEVDTKHLDRFAEMAATFDSHYAGSLPCMPARREWLTGTQELLWRPWGPIEPFDTTIPEAARNEGIVTQLITDHYHLFQHGASGYFEDYNGFEFIRGHEYDAATTTPKTPNLRVYEQTTVGDSEFKASTDYMEREQYPRNVDSFDELNERDFFAPKVFEATTQWLRKNREWDQWFCHVDSFDVHEPFHCPEPYASMYTDENPRDPDLPFWPYYGRIDRGQSGIDDRELSFIRSQFAGKITMVDRWFGRVLETLEDNNYLEDTMVIVTADHGHYLGEHGWIGKPSAPLYNTLAQTPLLIWHPESERMGERIDVLSSAVDLYGTILDVLGLDDMDHRHSKSLEPVLTTDRDHHRDWAIYGYWGSSLNVTDGQYTYLHPCDETIEPQCYSTQMINPNWWFVPQQPKTDVDSGTFLPYTDVPVWQIEGDATPRHDDPMLFDVETDPGQQDDIAGRAPETAADMRSLLVEAMDELNAPPEQYERLRLD